MLTSNKNQQKAYSRLIKIILKVKQSKSKMIRLIICKSKSIDFSHIELQNQVSTYCQKRSFYITHFIQPRGSQLSQMQPNKQIKFILQGVQIPITPLMFREMKFFQQWQVLSSSQADSFELPQKSVVTLSQWKIIIQILEHFKYLLPNLPKVRTNDPYSIIGAFLTDKFKAMNRTQLNRLYVAAHFLKIKNLRASIAAYYATQVYFQGEKDYDQRLKENKVKRPLTSQLFNSYRQDYTFLNHY